MAILEEVYHHHQPMKCKKSAAFKSIQLLMDKAKKKARVNTGKKRNNDDAVHKGRDVELL